MDGYDASGNRVYDKVSGMTCHQCRQKTLGRHTSCSKCQTLHVRALTRPVAPLRAYVDWAPTAFFQPWLACQMRLGSV